MTIGITVICCSILYIILVATVYFSKKKIKNLENKIYSSLLILNVVGLFLELGCCYFLYNKDISSLYTFLNILINKTFVVYLLTWEFIFTAYIFFISFNQKESFKEKVEKNKNSILTLISIIYLGMISLVAFLPLYYFNDGTYLYSYGPATNLLYIVGGIFILFDIFCLFKNFEDIKNKKYYPLFILVLLMILVFVLRQINPGLIVINSVFAFVTSLMFFTIENPDLNLVKEYKEAKDYAENSNSSKELFMNTGSKTIKELVKIVNNMCDEISTYDNINDIKEGITEIKSYSNQSLTKLNKILDFSAVKESDIKVLNNKYNPNLLFEQLILHIKNNIEKNNSNIELIQDIDKNIPNTLYGDSIRVKEILKYIIDNSLNNPKNKFIELTVNYINKDNICRLLITIEDSMPENFNGLETDKNDLSENSEILELKNLVNIIGGTLMVTNTMAGRKFVVVLDQKISLEKHEDKLDVYTKEYIESENKKRIIIVYNDKISANKLALKIKKHKVNIDVVSMGQTCLEKIRADEQYDLIILDDNLPKLSSTRVLEKLKEIPGFNTPVVLLLKNKNTELEDRYVNIGFSECLIKPLDNKEINSLVNKYLIKWVR